MADPVVTPEPTAGEAQEAHFEAALAAAIKEAPLPGAEPEADRILGMEKTPEADIATEEQRQADALKEAEAKPKAEDDDKEDEEKPETDVNVSPGTLGKARRLLAEGKVEEALELALGINLDKVEPTTKQWKGVKRIAVQARQEAAEARAFAEQEVGQARHVVTTLKPFVDAAQAYLKGDFKTFLELSTGDTPEAFQRKLIGQLHETPKADPVLSARLERLEQERVQERQAWQQEQLRLQQANAQMTYQQQVQAWKGGITAELKDSEYAKVAEKPAFVEHVYALQAKHLNAKTRTTIDTLEAAAMVYEELYDGVVETQPAEGKVGKTQSPRVNGDTPERKGKNAGKTTSLRLQAATEAAPVSNGPWSPENQEKILEQFTRMAKSELAA